MDNLFLYALQDISFQSDLIAEEFNEFANSNGLKNHNIAHGYPYIEYNKEMDSIIMRKDIFLLNENHDRVQKRELFSVVTFQQTDQIM